jgi:hypothetical protein
VEIEEHFPHGTCESRVVFVPLASSLIASAAHALTRYGGASINHQRGTQGDRDEC